MKLNPLPGFCVMVRDGVVRCQDGTDISVQADTVCVHGDGVKALALRNESIVL
jgi:UPF0271 protein